MSPVVHSRSGFAEVLRRIQSSWGVSTVWYLSSNRIVLEASCWGPSHDARTENPDFA